jgi:hypothetical protein
MTVIGPVEHTIRVKDGARKQCPDHPDGPMVRIISAGSGAPMTCCDVPGCHWLAQWVKPGSSNPTDTEESSTL